MKKLYVSNIVERLRANPHYGCYAVEEDFRKTFTKYVAKHPFQYTFDEMNMLLLYNAGEDDDLHENAQHAADTASVHSTSSSLSNEAPSSNNSLSSPENSLPATPLEQVEEEDDAKKLYHTAAYDDADHESTSPKAK